MIIRHFIVVQSLSYVWLFATPWTAACQVSLSFAISWSLFKFMSIELVMPPNHLILCHPLLLLPSVFPSIRVFSSESVLHIRWPKYWSCRDSLSSEYSGLISFRIAWFDLLAAQGTLNSFLQHHSSKPSKPEHNFGAQPSLWSNCCICTWLLEKPYLWLLGSLSAKWRLCFLICCLGFS